MTVGTAADSMGTYLVGGSGRALYLWVADRNGTSSCSGECAKIWPPLIATGKPQVSGAVNAADLTLINRPDGTRQVAYNGHPLYYYVADRSSGATTGQGNDGFGARWWLVAPSGRGITTGGTSSTASSSSSYSSPYGG